MLPIIIVETMWTNKKALWKSTGLSYIISLIILKLNRLLLCCYLHQQGL